VARALLGSHQQQHLRTPDTRHPKRPWAQCSATAPPKRTVGRHGGSRWRCWLGDEAAAIAAISVVWQQRSVEPRERSRQAGPVGALLQGQRGLLARWSPCAVVAAKTPTGRVAGNAGTLAQRHDFAVDNWPQRGPTTCGPIMRVVTEMGRLRKACNVWAFGQGTLAGGPALCVRRGYQGRDALNLCSGAAACGFGVHPISANGEAEPA